MKISDQARQKLITRGYDPDFLQQGIDRWVATGYGIDPDRLLSRCYGTSTCGCYECAGTKIEGYDLHGLPPQYASVVFDAWDKVDVQ